MQLFYLFSLFLLRSFWDGLQIPLLLKIKLFIIDRFIINHYLLRAHYKVLISRIIISVGLWWLFPLASISPHKMIIRSWHKRKINIRFLVIECKLSLSLFLNLGKQVSQKVSQTIIFCCENSNSVFNCDWSKPKLKFLNITFIGKSFNFVFKSRY